MNGDLYIHRQYVHTLSQEIVDQVSKALHHLPISCDWNLAKVDCDGTHITFSNYPGFEIIAHPKLEQWNRVDVVFGEVIAEKGSIDNPIILHRKETFIDQSDNNYDAFAHLTRQEMIAGLYAKETLSRIGRMKFWEHLLEEKGLKIIDHDLYYSTGKEFEIDFRRDRER